MYFHNEDLIWLINKLAVYMINSKPVGLLNGALHSLKTNLISEKSSGNGGDTIKANDI
jgi:hypothetical protein